jgi:hypothetical protein
LKKNFEKALKYLYWIAFFGLLNLVGLLVQFLALVAVDSSPLGSIIGFFIGLVLQGVVHVYYWKQEAWHGFFRKPLDPIFDWVQDKILQPFWDWQRRRR